MGRFVLGILAVILLQIAFFGYTSMYWTAPRESMLAKNRRPVTELSRDMVQPQLAPPAPPLAEVTPSLPSPGIERPAATQRARIRTIPPKKERERKVNIARVVTAERTRTENPQLSAVAPRRYAVVVTDPIAKVSTTTAYSSDISKLRKRSFLAKTFSVVVKKPWGWMKSLASKLD